ncbi:unnamed protein product [Aspergillus oryzae]|uniref:Unnamed protein product n=2 Tax=Aspergillus oryzae TaxID=5062 RepID=A0AAN5C3A9_ASPOZ|nr:unnamed protein product [Aspergillus oryzae]GMF85320.1 unnamed protein product [Aspergillus oryzae]GMG04327.1 unnamed protein product [Aspergillus oryzae]GMG36084.1 unnamed protein product [Aspergillus oryzae]GMG42897.1 unnamed protein product [Aspergillus oryzae var. brunneus]
MKSFKNTLSKPASTTAHRKPPSPAVKTTAFHCAQSLRTSGTKPIIRKSSTTIAAMSSRNTQVTAPPASGPNPDP